MAHLPPWAIRPEVIAAPYGAAGRLLAAAPEDEAPVPEGGLSDADSWLDHNGPRLAASGLPPERQRQIAHYLPRMARAALLEHLPALMAAGYAPDDVGRFVLQRGHGNSLPALARVLPLFAARHYSVLDVLGFLSIQRVGQRLAAFEADPTNFNALDGVQRQLVLQAYLYV